MCGPNQQQENLTNEQAAFYQNLTNQYNTVFGQDQAITGALTSAFTPILQAGPSQTGFSPSETSALQTQNTENVATDYAQAQRATAQILAAKGGGNTFLPSSTTSNILASNANAAAATMAAGQNKITQANYNQGYQNWQTAAQILGQTANTLNPTGFASTTTGAGTSAMSSATALANTSFAPWGAAMGALGSIGGLATGAAINKWG